MAGTWWWAAYRHDTRAKLTWRQKQRIAVKSFLAGVTVYFLLLVVAALYLTLNAL